MAGPVNLVELERIVRQAAASLAESLQLYGIASPGAWAAAELCEANVALHLGRGLLNAGFLAHAEARAAGRPEQRTDVTAIHPAAGALVIAEAKRLDGHAGAAASLYDLSRLATFAPPDYAQRLRGNELAARYGVLAATSANREHARWFTTMSSNPIAPTPELAALHAQLPADTIWNGYALAEGADAAGQRRTEWLLYALFQAR